MSEHAFDNFAESFGRVEALVTAIESSADVPAIAAARELTQVLLKLHGAGWNRMLALLAESGDAGKAITAKLGEDALLSSLLMLHGLHPTPIEERIQEAIARSRQQILALGGTVELLSVEGGNARILLHAPTPGPAQAAMQRVIEEAIYEHAPDVAELHIEGLEERVRPPAPMPNGLITLRLPNGGGRR